MAVNAAGGGAVDAGGDCSGADADGSSVSLGGFGIGISDGDLGGDQSGISIA